MSFTIHVATIANYLQILLPVVSDLLWFDLPVLDINLVPAQHNGYALAHVLQVTDATLAHYCRLI